MSDPMWFLTLSEVIERYRGHSITNLHVWSQWILQTTEVYDCNSSLEKPKRRDG